MAKRIKRVFSSADQVLNHVVYPGHGVGKVLKRETREVLGVKTEFLSIEILDTGMKIMVPVKALDQVGVRPLIDRDTALKARDILSSPGRIDHGTWSSRYREYMERIKTGDPLEIAHVIAALQTLKVEKELSFGERKLLDNARALLCRELSIVLGVDAIRDLIGGAL